MFEHLDKLHVTAVLGFVDVEDLVGSMNLSKTKIERVSVTLKTNIEESIPAKDFLRRYVVSANKTERDQRRVLYATPNRGSRIQPTY